MARRNIVDRYSRATVEKRVEIILDNYATFNRILDGYEKSLSIVIRNERDFNRKKQLGDSGIRVQTSNISDITAQTAIENVEIQEAIHDGDWRTATKGSDNIFEHRLEIETIGQMRDDYDIVTGQLSALLKEEYDFYLPYINREKNCFEIAEEQGLSPEAVRMRLYRYRLIVKESALPFMERVRGVTLQKCA
jgi:hypothetical protein